MLNHKTTEKCEGSGLCLCPMTVVSHCGFCGAPLCMQHVQTHTCGQFEDFWEEVTAEPIDVRPNSEGNEI